MTSRRGTDAIARETTRRSRGTVFVISAPSGAGKTTLCKRLLQELQGIEFSVSFTTRAPREGEREGVDYCFIDREEFERRRRKGGFVEWALVDGQMYGTSGAAVKEVTGRGHDIVLDVDTQGAENIRRLVSDAVLIFVMPPSRDALKERLARRATDTPETVARRLSLARGEVEKSPLYDYVVINDDLDVAYDQVRAIVVAARCRRERVMGRIKEVAASFGVGRPPGREG